MSDPTCPRCGGPMERREDKGKHYVVCPTCPPRETYVKAPSNEAVLHQELCAAKQEIARLEQENAGLLAALDDVTEERDEARRSAEGWADQLKAAQETIAALRAELEEAE